MMPLQRDSAILHKPMSAFNTPPFELIQTSTNLSWTCTPKGEIDLLPHVNRHVLVFWPYGQTYGAQVLCPPKRQSRAPWPKRLRRWMAGVRQSVETVYAKLWHTFRLD